VQGEGYSAVFTTTRGTAFTWTVSSGILPPGLTLSTGGTLSGTAFFAGTFDFVIQARELSSGASGESGSKSFELTITGTPRMTGM
jgi:hypothetical protein